MRKKLTRYRLNENLIELELFLRGKKDCNFSLCKAIQTEKIEKKVMSHAPNNRIKDNFSGPFKGFLDDCNVI